MKSKNETRMKIAVATNPSTEPVFPVSIVRGDVRSKELRNVLPTNINILKAKFII